MHEKFNARTGYKSPWRVKVLNRVTRRLINYLPNGAVPKPFLYTGKTLHWDFVRHRFLARDTRVIF